MREQFKAYYRWARAGCMRPDLLPTQRDERVKMAAHQALIDRLSMRRDETYNIHARHDSRRLDIYHRQAEEELAAERTAHRESAV